MSRSSRTLTALYAATAGWLAWMATATASHVPAYVTISLAAAAAAHVLFSVREIGHAEKIRALRVQLERASRPTAADHGTPLTASEQAAFNRLAAAVDLPGPNDPRNAA